MRRKDTEFNELLDEQTNNTGKTEGITEGDIMLQFLEELSEPFPIEQHSYKPLSLSKNGNGAWIAYYVDLRHMMRRFQEVAAKYNINYSFYCDLLLFNELGATVKGEVFLCRNGVYPVKYEDFGYAPQGSPEPPKSAVTDAYRRVLSQLGIGRYLYHLPKVFIGGDFSSYPQKYDFNPLEVLKEAMESTADVIIRTKQRSAKDTKDSRDSKDFKEPNETQKTWMQNYFVESVDELVSALKEGAGLRSSPKQIAAYTRLVPYHEEDLTDAEIKQKLDELLGEKKTQG